VTPSARATASASVVERFIEMSPDGMGAGGLG
jgi:hypothetical protein